MTYREILIALGSSIVGGVVVWLIQQGYLNRRENKKSEAQKIIRASNDQRLVTNDIFEDLSPGKSIALMREMLGGPRKYGRNEVTVFSEEEVVTNSYLYNFKNAVIKITSRDNETIDTLTVMPDESLTVEYLFFPDEQSTYKFNEVKVCSELLERSSHTSIISIRDNSFAIRQSLGPPHDKSITYFGYSDNQWEYHETKDPKLLIGGIINGVCIAQEGQDAYFISDSELR